MARNQIEKLHAACDECRTRKLKCSGELPKCSRCSREGIACVHSPQKQMGRPRKRRQEKADTPENYSDSAPALNGPSFTEFELVPPPGLSESSGYSNFQDNNTLANPNRNLMHADPTCTFAHSASQSLTPNLDSFIDPVIDPSLWDAQPSDPTIDLSVVQSTNQPEEVACTCLSILYLALSELQSLSSFAFPAVIPPLRNAMTTVSSIMNCEQCPRNTFTLIQNVQSLTSLLSAIGERFHRVLKEIDAEAKRLERTGEKKAFRMGDSNPQLQHLHTGTPDCPLGYSLELEAKDWKIFAKKALRTEVLGGGSNPRPLTVILDQFEQRQLRGHSDEAKKQEFVQLFGAQNVCRSDDAMCIRHINQIRGMINNMQWD